MRRWQEENRLLQAVSLQELELYRADPLREDRLRQEEFAICRECGWRARRLRRHIRSIHQLEPATYLAKWNNPPLIATRYREEMSEKTKERALRTGLKYFHTRDGVNKRHVLSPDEGANSRKGKPATAAMKRAHRRNAEEYAGKPRHDRRGKRLLGSDRHRAHWTQAVPISDAQIVEFRTGQQLHREIAANVGLTAGAIAKRLERLGFPSRACRFIHGEPVAKKHFLDLCKDFGQTKGAVIKSAKLNYWSVLNHLSHLGDAGVLSVKVGDAILALRTKWTEAFCVQAVSGKKVRNFLQSELRDLANQQRQLTEAVGALRKWLRTQNGQDQTPDILNWICEQARLEVAKSGNVETSAGFRPLMFLWGSLRKLLRNEPTLLTGKRALNLVVSDLLALDYGATTGRITEAVAGKTDPLQPKALAIATKSREKAGGPRRRSEEERQRFKVVQSVKQCLPRFVEAMKLLKALRKTNPDDASYWRKSFLARRYSGEEIDAILWSKTPKAAAQRHVAHLWKWKLHSVQSACSALWNTGPKQEAI
jgi:hypothetical protein